MSRGRLVLSVWFFVVFLLTSAPTWAGPVVSGVEAQRMVQRLLAGRTPPLKLGAVREAGQSYEVEVVTPKGTLVDRLLVEKSRGQVRSLYGQTLLSLDPIGGQRPALAPGGS